MNIADLQIVLKLNRNWGAMEQSSVGKCVVDMATGVLWE